MKYEPNTYALIKFSRIGKKKRIKIFKNFITAKSALDKYIKKNVNCSAVITRVLYNSETKNDKWTYNKDKK